MALVRTKSGRRFSDRHLDHDGGAPAQSSAADPRVLLPLSKREHTQETLADGTILISYRDPPLGAPLIELPDEIEEHSTQTWKADKPSAPKSEGLDRWNGPLGPRNSRKRA